MAFALNIKEPSRAPLSPCISNTPPVLFHLNYFPFKRKKSRREPALHFHIYIYIYITKE
ncbi:hypothetical protein NC653_007880 [Populus alba x Populus x berolinensis]|uniref:Uncharacterized protein n=1 Tax=Populus alba x Populus x berolinensis TaxID=444605 RepID=A0AAD6W7S9_9ROSI|nr:hypothetical protein NC653_007880 [Populus alba x Populus x berolinensis]